MIDANNITDDDILPEEEVTRAHGELRTLYMELHGLLQRRDRLENKLFRSGLARQRKAEREHNAE